MRTQFAIPYGDTVVYVDATDFDRTEWRPLQQALGMRATEITLAAIGLDLDALAGLLWMHLRREQPDLQFDAITLTLGEALNGAQQQRSREEADQTGEPIEDTADPPA